MNYESLSRVINIACLNHAYVKRIGPRGQRALGADDIAITISKQFKPTHWYKAKGARLRFPNIALFFSVTAFMLVTKDSMPLNFTVNRLKEKKILIKNYNLLMTLLGKISRCEIRIWSIFCPDLKFDQIKMTKNSKECAKSSFMRTFKIFFYFKKWKPN